MCLKACQSRKFDSSSAGYRRHTWDEFLLCQPGSSMPEEEMMAQPLHDGQAAAARLVTS